MNYKKLSDQELNMLVAAYWCEKCEVYPHPRNFKAAATLSRFGHERPFMAVNRPEDSYYIILANRIALIPHGKTRWMAYHENGMSVTDGKPLRAAMIIYLMLCEEAEKAGQVKS